MWQYKINSTKIDGGNAVANVTLWRDDGDLESITRDVQADDLNKANLEKFLGNIIASRTKRDEAKIELDTLVGQKIQITLP